MDDTISNPSMEPLLFSIDTMSGTQQKLKLLVDNGDYGFERGPRYGEYARLRESKLRMKRDFEKILKEEQIRFGLREDDEIRVLPEKKTTRFGFNPSLNQRKAATTSSSSSLAQSVPDFSVMIRKENRRPVNSNLLPRRTELTPPPVKSRNAAVFAGSALRGSVSASAGEKKGIGMMMRKSYATVEDLKKVSMAAASAINGGGGGGRKSIGGGGRKSIGGGGRTILGYRQIY
ncbi:PREDICTED: uncharacterized protein LOC104701298 [Camelina sativa]|uniref:Uncharacterized protein LOC104701298 n=1 Tax=Camelina sativa TaxID=90675 RepID=A0ABM0SRW3_CAMSA|nr:PREDICTED: uncharacterized protein LOC104701298 [Camelina sativa]